MGSCNAIERIETGKNIATRKNGGIKGTERRRLRQHLIPMAPDRRAVLTFHGLDVPHAPLDHFYRKPIRPHSFDPQMLCELLASCKLPR